MCAAVRGQAVRRFERQNCKAFCVCYAELWYIPFFLSDISLSHWTFLTQMNKASLLDCGIWRLEINKARSVRCQVTTKGLFLSWRVLPWLDEAETEQSNTLHRFRFIPCVYTKCFIMFLVLLLVNVSYATPSFKEVLQQLGSSTKTSPVLVPSIPMNEKSVLNWQDYICSYLTAPSFHTDYDFRLIWRFNTIPSR